MDGRAIASKIAGFVVISPVVSHLMADEHRNLASLPHVVDSSNALLGLAATEVGHLPSMLAGFAL